jgi:acyl-CoA synthetase (AMP-forming)/AMP-acid ligase II
MPKLIEIRPHLPRTAVGKLSKTELRAELKARQAVPDPHHAGAAP